MVTWVKPWKAMELQTIKLTANYHPLQPQLVFLRILCHFVQWNFSDNMGLLYIHSLLQLYVFWLVPPIPINLVPLVFSH